VFEKWGKLYPGTPFPISSEKEQRTSDAPSAEPPVSFSKEYKQMMELKSEFPALYDEAVKELNVKPDTVVNCVNISAMIGRKIDERAASEPPVESYEPPPVTDTSGF